MQVRKIVNVLYKDAKLEVSSLGQSAILLFSKKNPVASAAEKKALATTCYMPIENPIIRNYYRTRPIPVKTQRLLGQAQDLSLKLEGVEDGIIRDAILSRLAPFSKMSKTVNLDYFTGALDAYHGVKGNYFSVSEDAHDYIKYFNKVIKPTSKKKLNVESFQKAVKLEGLKIFCTKYDSELVDYMYKEYYLRDLPLESKNICRKILTEFGTKVFLEHDENHKAANAIYKELAEWKNAGGDKVIFPSVVDCSPIKQLFIDKKSPADGYAIVRDKFIALDGDEEVISYAFRHEMGHVNDENYFFRDSQARGAIYSAYKPLFDKMPFVWMKKLALHVIEELRVEDVAEATEKDYAKLSEKRKKTYSGIGVPKWVFDMKPIKDMDYFG